ncbi:hypothetical protein UCDDS831_g05014 [Diplodia seriata]|uniref:Uncharacterized protein n=1 Tax=Diplodia seriata TaxID=420778 RepID=A0A0G2G955_9PEZI|nr:hypothetical protein UCDDS831_g05014 [Diplodia seriata]
MPATFGSLCEDVLETICENLCDPEEHPAELEELAIHREEGPWLTSDEAGIWALDIPEPIFTKLSRTLATVQRLHLTLSTGDFLHHGPNSTFKRNLAPAGFTKERGPRILLRFLSAMPLLSSLHLAAATHSEFSTSFARKVLRGLPATLSEIHLANMLVSGPILAHFLNAHRRALASVGLTRLHLTGDASWTGIFRMLDVYLPRLRSVHLEQLWELQPDFADKVVFYVGTGNAGASDGPFGRRVYANANAEQAVEQRGVFVEGVWRPPAFRVFFFRPPPLDGGSRATEGDFGLRVYAAPRGSPPPGAFVVGEWRPEEDRYDVLEMNDEDEDEDVWSVREGLERAVGFAERETASPNTLHVQMTPSGLDSFAWGTMHPGNTTQIKNVHINVAQFNLSGLARLSEDYGNILAYDELAAPLVALPPALTGKLRHLDPTNAFEHPSNEEAGLWAFCLPQATFESLKPSLAHLRKVHLTLSSGEYTEEGTEDTTHVGSAGYTAKQALDALPPTITKIHLYDFVASVSTLCIFMANHSDSVREISFSRAYLVEESWDPVFKMMDALPALERLFFEKLWELHPEFADKLNFLPDSWPARIDVFGERIYYRRRHCSWPVSTGRFDQMARWVFHIKMYDSLVCENTHGLFDMDARGTLAAALRAERETWPNTFLPKKMIAHVCEVFGMEEADFQSHANVFRNDAKKEPFRVDLQKFTKDQKGYDPNDHYLQLAVQSNNEGTLDLLFRFVADNEADEERSEKTNEKTNESENDEEGHYENGEESHKVTQ